MFSSSFARGPLSRKPLYSIASIKFAIFALGLLFALSAACGASFDRSARVSEKDVTYCTADGVALKLDLYFPKATDSGSSAPVVIYVHGGSWQLGDKSLLEGWEKTVVKMLTARGYLVAVPNYRLAPQDKWPAQIQDVKCAVRYLRANASTYDLDPNRIGAWGASAGGHLVALLGPTDANDGLEGQSEYADQSSRVQAVVDMFGPTDLTAGNFVRGPHINEELVRAVFGGTATDVLMRASPVSYVSKDAPPFLILHGNKDRLVPPAQSRELYDQLKAEAVPAKLVMVQNAGHGFGQKGVSIKPNMRKIKAMIVRFFDQNLRGTP
jgi:acetyl esterase/lipase